MCVRVSGSVARRKKCSILFFPALSKKSGTQYFSFFGPYNFCTFCFFLAPSITYAHPHTHAHTHIHIPMHTHTSTHTRSPSLSHSLSLSNPSHRTPSKNVKVPVKKVLLTFGGGISKDFGIFWKWVEIEIERSDKIFSISFFPIFRLFCLDPIDSFWRIKKKLLLRLKTFGARTSKTGSTPIVHRGPYFKSVV